MIRHTILDSLCEGELKMPISHTVWSLDAKKPLEAASLNDEKELELLLRDNIEILSKD